MTGQFQGVVTRLQKESANTKFYRVWCGLHQLDLVLKHAYTDLWENEVVDIMKKFIAHLRLQQGLIAEMQSTCPQLTTRWLVMGIVCTWMLDKRIEIFEYIDSAATPVTSAPPKWWWVIIAGISALTDLVNPVFIKLQAPDLLVSAQTALLESLAIDISTMLGISSCEEGVVLGKFEMKYGRWRVDYATVQKFLQGLGIYTRHTLDEMDDEMTSQVFESIGKLGVAIVEGIVNIQAERDQYNHADGDLPHVLPHELVKISTGHFGKTVVDPHLQQLQHFWNEKNIGGIESEHRELVMAYRNEPALGSAIDDYSRLDIKSFDTAWKVVEGRFEILRDFCGGIATVFANTASVESDFSILGWEKDQYRLSITDLSLEGILHCKQYKKLGGLVI
jgi:hypothetical protein